MPAQQASDRIFESVLQNAQDISNKYYNDADLQNSLSDDPSAFEELLDAFRDRMHDNGGIHKIHKVDPTVVSRIEQDHNAGRIAAVDGTDAIALTEVMSKTIYAAGVISTTARTLHEPRISMTESHRTIPALSQDDDLDAFVFELDRWVDHDNSWKRTFREYCERTEALRLIEQDESGLVLVDGPLFTQNLLSQSVAQTGILKAMLAHPEKLIGFIKSMHSSKVMHLAGMALQPGEYWEIGGWRNMLRQRFSSGSEGAGEWIGKASWFPVRVVYRKNRKAYAFECHADLVETGIALIHSPISCADITNHEIPFLLHQADRIIQARVAATAKSDNLISSSIHYANLANERRFR